MATKTNYKDELRRRTTKTGCKEGLRRRAAKRDCEQGLRIGTATKYCEEEFLELWDFQNEGILRMRGQQEEFQ